MSRARALWAKQELTSKSGERENCCGPLWVSLDLFLALSFSDSLALSGPLQIYDYFDALIQQLKGLDKAPIFTWQSTPTSPAFYQKAPQSQKAWARQSSLESPKAPRKTLDPHKLTCLGKLGKSSSLPTLPWSGHNDEIHLWGRSGGLQLLLVSAKGGSATTSTVFITFIMIHDHHHPNHIKGRPTQKNVFFRA